MRGGRRVAPAVPVGPGERVLAWSHGGDGEVLAGTRDAIYLVEGELVTRIPWEQVEAADWDRESEVLRVSEVGSWGQVRRELAVAIEEPGRLLELVRERVTASVVLQRHVPVSGRRGLRVIARRAPRGDRAMQWFFEYDEGVDPDDPAVRDAARSALAAAQDEVGAS